MRKSLGNLGLRCEYANSALFSPMCQVHLCNELGTVQAMSAISPSFRWRVHPRVRQQHHPKLLLSLQPAHRRFVAACGGSWSELPGSDWSSACCICFFYMECILPVDCASIEKTKHTSMQIAIVQSTMIEWLIRFIAMFEV